MKIGWMRLVAGLGATVALSACAQGPDVVDGPNWVGPRELPKGMSFYPPRALRMEKPGLVALNCYMETDGRLDDCKVVSEAPQGYGFGEAALRMYSSIVIRMSQAEMVAAQADKNHFRVIQPVFFEFDLKSCLAVEKAWLARRGNLPGDPGCDYYTKPKKR